MLANCHDQYHDTWGEDHKASEAACLMEADALPMNGSDIDMGNFIECRQHFCDMAASDEALCANALGDAVLSREAGHSVARVARVSGDLAGKAIMETLVARAIAQPVQVSAVLGKATMQVSQLLKLGRGAVVELDRKVGEAIDIYVNNRLVARGEVVVVEEHLGVTMTEIIKVDRSGS